MRPQPTVVLRGRLPCHWLAPLAAALALAAALSTAGGAEDSLLEAAWWAPQESRLLAWQQQSPALFLAGFVLLFVLLSATALPGCAALSLRAGNALGTFAGTLRVGLASTLGALLAFLAARHRRIAEAG